MKTSLTFASLLLLLFAGTGTLAQTGGAASPFGFGVGARDLALGGADVAVCDYATAPFWNPARLARAEKYTVMGFHSRLFDSDVTYQYLGLVLPTLDWGSLGIGITRLGIDGIEKRDASNLLLDSISDSRLGLRLAYGRSVGSFDLGATFSIETHSLDTYKATSTPGLDIAATRKIPSPYGWCDDICLTLVGRNIIAPSMRLVDESIKSPFEFQAGLSGMLLMSPDHRQTLEISGGLTKRDNTPGSGSLGLELSLFDILQLRGSIQEDKFSGGAGISYNGISFDYAMVDRELGALHMISLTTSIGKSVSERRSIRAERREAAFNRLMSERLTQKNGERANELLESGKRALSAGDLAAADASFDRALFLARNSGIDTTEYAMLAARVRTQILQTSRRIELAAHLDSARAHLAALDFSGCRYFAGLALSVDSTSTEAMDMSHQAAEASAEVARQQEFVQRRVWLIDSLISYGAPIQALTAAQSLHNMAPDNALAQVALKKAEFECFKATAEKEMVNREYQRSIDLLDSALVRFPGQARCLELQKTCRNEIQNLQSGLKMPTVKAVALSRDVLKQVQHSYDQAQTAFNRGDLSQAIEAWEEVERLAPGYQSVREYLLKAYRFVGVDLYGQNRLREALTIWEKALKVAPNNSEIAAYARRTRNEIEKLKELSYDE